MEAEVFNKEEALSFLDNDSELLTCLLEAFLEVPFNLEELNEFIRLQRFSQAAGYVHAVKGAARQLSAKKLALSGQNLEDVLRGKDSGDFDILVPAFFNDYQQLVKMIKDELEK